MPRGALRWWEWPRERAGRGKKSSKSGMVGERDEGGGVRARAKNVSKREIIKGRESHKVRHQDSQR